MKKILFVLLMKTGVSFCLSSGMGPFGTPGGLILNPTNTYAFTLGTHVGSVVSCNVKDGTMSNCQEQALADVKITVREHITMDSDGNYIFITNSNSNILQCQVSGNQLINCTQEPYAADAIGIYKNQAYLFTYSINNDSSVRSCSLNNGQLSNCVENTQLHGKINYASVVTINSSGTRAYISNTDNTIYSCPIVNQQISSDCSSSQINNTTQINGVALGNNSDYIFLGNMMDSSTAKVNNGSIQRCKLNTDGTLTDCNNSGAQKSSTIDYFFPEYIAFTNDGLHAFITNAADTTNITHCDVGDNTTLKNCSNAIK